MNETSSVCRACLSTRAKFGLDDVLREILSLCVPMGSEDLPEFVCRGCRKTLLKFHNFRLTAQRVDRLLRESLSQKNAKRPPIKSYKQRKRKKCTTNKLTSENQLQNNKTDQSTLFFDDFCYEVTTECSNGTNESLKKARLRLSVDESSDEFDDDCSNVKDCISAENAFLSDTMQCSDVEKERNPTKKKYAIKKGETTNKRMISKKENATINEYKNDLDVTKVIDSTEIECLTKMKDTIAINATDIDDAPKIEYTTTIGDAIDIENVTKMTDTSQIEFTTNMAHATETEHNSWIGDAIDMINAINIKNVDKIEDANDMKNTSKINDITFIENAIEIINTIDKMDPDNTEFATNMKNTSKIKDITDLGNAIEIINTIHTTDVDKIKDVMDRENGNKIKDVLVLNAIDTIEVNETDIGKEAKIEEVTDGNPTGTEDGTRKGAGRVRSRGTGSVCTQCGYRAADRCSLLVHSRTHTGDKPFSCAICSKTFSVLSNLKAHAFVHTRERRFVCEVCGRALASAASLRGHARGHTGVRPHECALCRRRFALPSNLTRHMRTHSGEKPYPCRTCGRAFASSSDARAHTRTHTGERPHACARCPRRFAAVGNLRAHERTHSPRLPCARCGLLFRTKSERSEHARTHKSEITKALQDHRCDLCDKSFARKCNLVMHKKREKCIRQSSSANQNPAVVSPSNQIQEQKDSANENTPNAVTANHNSTLIISANPNQECGSDQRSNLIIFNQKTLLDKTVTEGQSAASVTVRQSNAERVSNTTLLPVTLVPVTLLR